MNKPTLHYDEVSDTLYISYEPGTPATGIELNEHILLRIDSQREKAIGLTLFDYSVLAQPTDLGPRSFPLTGLASLSHDLRERVIKLLRSPPVSETLVLSAYTPSAVETIPIILLHPVLAETA